MHAAGGCLMLSECSRCSKQYPATFNFYLSFTGSSTLVLINGGGHWGVLNTATPQEKLTKHRHRIYFQIYHD